MQEINLTDITIDPVALAVFSEKGIECNMLRLDKLHPVISGNKWFKLRYYIEEAKKAGKIKLLTFGGAWSNHIAATAAAGQLYGLHCTGIIRGEEPAHLSNTLTTARQMGMELVFVSREDFRHKKIPGQFSDRSYYIINEGGYGQTGANGAATITEHFKKENYTHICCAVGTGTMMAGLINNTDDRQQVTGISVLKNNYDGIAAVQSLLINKDIQPAIIHDYHFGGYAKHTPALLEFMNSFYQQTGIPTDFVYTAKLCYAIASLAEKNYFPEHSRLLLIHSGGLQGNSSLPKGTLIF